jgi:paraquat-inducible protein A
MIRPERLAAAPSAAPKPARLKRRSRLDALIGWMIPLCAVALAVSWFMPLMTVKKLWIWEDKVSIASGLIELLDKSELFLFFVILLFSIIFPLAKLAGAYVLWFHVDWYGPWARRYASLIRALGRWSMLDVFVVALTVVALNVSIVTNVETHFGIYAFTGAIVISMLVVHRIEWLMSGAVGEAATGRPRPN